METNGVSVKFDEGKKDKLPKCVLSFNVCVFSLIYLTSYSLQCDKILRVNFKIISLIFL